MATDRQTPCLYYVCAGLCTKGRKADHAHYCQHCNKYKPRARVRYKNQKKEKLEKIRKNERYQNEEKIEIFYIWILYRSSLVGVWFGRIYDCGNVTMKILLILIPLAIYWFFIIGKSIIEEKIKKNFSTQGKT